MTSDGKKKIICPGEVLAASEEALPGRGTFDTGEAICAYQTGEPEINKELEAHIRPVTSMPVILRRGDIVIGEITRVKPSMAVAEIEHLAGVKRGLTGETEGTLRVANASDSYIPELNKAYRKRDVIRAVVIGTRPSLQISTKGRGLGCINALCSECGATLVKKGRNLWCDECEHTESRNTADDYGEGHLDRTNV